MANRLGARKKFIRRSLAGKGGSLAKGLAVAVVLLTATDAAALVRHAPRVTRKGGGVFSADECRRGPARFSEAFAKYFDTVGERFVGKDDRWLRRTMEGEDKSRYELDLIATPALPEDYPFMLSRMGCWMQIYDYRQAMQRGNYAQGDALIEAWRSCLGSFHQEKMPALAREVIACHASARASGLQKNLPKDVKETPAEDESQLLPQASKTQPLQPDSPAGED